MKAIKFLPLLVLFIALSGCDTEKVDDDTYTLSAPPLQAKFEIENECGKYEMEVTFDGISLVISISEVGKKTKDLSNLKIRIRCISHIEKISAPGRVTIEEGKIEVEFDDKFSTGKIEIIFDGIYPATDTDMSFKASKCEEHLIIPGPDLCVHDQGKGE